MPTKAPAAPVWSWTGLYAGVHAGWGSASSGNSSASSFTAAVGGPLFLAQPFDVGDDGPLFGVHLGYNWQVAPAWVIGVEADWTGSGLRGFQSGPVSLSPGLAGLGIAAFTGGSAHMQRDVNWLASVRGRLGHTWDRSMIYATGGVAWADVDVSGDANPTGVAVGGVQFPVSKNLTQTGWTVGSGYETMLSANWLLRAEYLYYSFGGTTISAACAPAVCAVGAAVIGSSATYHFDSLNIHTARLGLSYKFGPAPSGAYAQAPLAAAGGWAGLYAGVHAGWGWMPNDNGTMSSNSVAFPAGLFAAPPYDLGGNGPLAGIHLGYNWQMAPSWMVGVEGDWTGTGMRGFQSSTVTRIGGAATSGTSHMQRDVNWLASVRGRLGYTWGANMIYATGGVAWADVDLSGDLSPPAVVQGCCSFPASASTTHTGWTVGGGYETMVLANWALRAEYLYYAFGGDTLTAACVGTPLACAGGLGAGATAKYNFGDLNIHTTRLGLSYKF